MATFAVFRPRRIIKSESKGKPVSAGAVRQEVFDALANYRKELGMVKSLDAVVTPVRLWDPTFRSFKNKYESVFTAFSVPSDLAERDECSGGTPPGLTTKEKYGDYFGAAFRFNDGGLNEGTLHFLWTAVQALANSEPEIHRR